MSVEYDSQYDHMNAGAHRRPAQQITAPALTWHRGFWHPTAVEQSEVPAIPFNWETLSAWHNNIDYALAAIFFHFYQLAVSDTATKRHHNSILPEYFTCSNLADGILYLFSNKLDFSKTRSGAHEFVELGDDEKSIRHDMFFLRTKIDGVHLVIVARRHLEYFCITFTSEYSNVTTLDGEGVIAQRSISKHFSELHDIAIRRYAESDGKTRNIMTDEEEIVAYDSDNKIVAPFKSWINDHCDAAFDACPLNRTSVLSDFGNVFADFFGAIFSLRLASEHALEFNGPGEIADGEELTLHHQVTGISFSDQLAPQVTDSIWPVANGFRKYHRLEEQFGKPESTVSLLQNRRTLYISSLGRILPNRTRHSNNHEPVFYTLVVSYGSKWRLGRIVDRLHTLGELRLAALRDMRAMTTSSNLINRAFTILGAIPLAQSHLPAMSEVYSLLDRAGKTMDIGLSMRLERARYYISNFKDLLDIVTPGPVEGFQSYTQFVHSRIFDTFEFIDRVGRRFEALRRAISIRLEVTHRTTIEDLQSATVKQTEATAKQTLATTHLLKTAEILSVIPIAYYSGNILFHAQLSLKQEFPFLSWLPREEWKYYAVGLAPGLIVAVLPSLIRGGLYPLWRSAYRRAASAASRLFPGFPPGH